MLAMGAAAGCRRRHDCLRFFFRPAENPEEIERKRRLHLNQIGRIAEGQGRRTGRPPARASRKKARRSSARRLSHSQT